MSGATPEASPDVTGATPPVGLRGWAQGLGARAAEPAARQAAVVTFVVAVAVIALGAQPLEGGFELDLREGDAVGGWHQVTLVGFSIVRPFGRVLPDQPGRSDLRIISNRPLPARFELTIEAWTLRPGSPVDLEVSLGAYPTTATTATTTTTAAAATASARFGADEMTRRMSFENPSGARVLSLALGPDDKLAVRRISVVESGGAP